MHYRRRYYRVIMIRILLVSNKNDEFLQFESSGHAGMSEKGSDIVCAAVTALLKTAVLSLKYAEKCSTGLKVKTDAQSSGNLSAEVIDFSDKDKPGLHYLFEFLAIGLAAIETEYPDYVVLQIRTC